jgi:DHA1 family inner membrane transport protein
MTTGLIAAPDTPNSGPPVPARHVPAWLSLLALAVGGFGIGTSEFASMGLLPDIARDMHATIPSAGYAITAYALGVVVGAPLLAILGARLRRKALLLSLMAALTAANLASALAGSFPLLVAARFASGLPHGAYFGIGAVVAASLVPAHRRARAVALMMTGLMVANVVGVPATTWLGQTFGWRSTYLTVVAVGLLTLVAIVLLVPDVTTEPGAGVRHELSALRRPQVWLTLLICAVGFGGLFAVYSYVTPTLTQVAGYRPAGVPIVLALLGLGMTCGNFVGGRLADWSVTRTIAGGLLAAVVVLLSFTAAAHAMIPAAVTLFLVGFAAVAAGPAVMSRLLDVSGDGQALGSALYHSAFNVANALGAWLGGLAIAAGFGYTAPAAVGAGLAVAGLGVLGVSLALDRRTAQRLSRAA